MAFDTLGKKWTWPASQKKEFKRKNSSDSSSSSSGAESRSRNSSHSPHHSGSDSADESKDTEVKKHGGIKSFRVCDRNKISSAKGRSFRRRESRSHSSSSEEFNAGETKSGVNITVSTFEKLRSESSIEIPSNSTNFRHLAGKSSADHVNSEQLPFSKEPYSKTLSNTNILKRHESIELPIKEKVIKNEERDTKYKDKKKDDVSSAVNISDKNSEIHKGNLDKFKNRKASEFRRSRTRSRSPERWHRRRTRSPYNEAKRSSSRERRRERSSERRRPRNESHRSYRRSSSRHSYKRSRSRDRHRSRYHRHRSSSRERSRRNRSRSSSRCRSQHSKERMKGHSGLAGSKLGTLPLSTATGAVTPQMALQQTMAAMNAKAQALTGIALPKYYNPAAVNPLKYAEQVQKRKLLWQSKDKPEEQQKNTVWDKLTFTQDQDGKMTAKFRKLMGIKLESEGNEGQSSSDIKESEEDAALKKQEELFRNLDQQYEMARMSTHTHRGVGLGYSSQTIFPPIQK